METDPFEQWEMGFTEVEMPADPLDAIVEQSIDPIDCAQALHRFIDSQPEEARSRAMRHGVNKLSRKYNGPYEGSRNLEVLINGGYAFPEAKPSLRRRDITDFIVLDDCYFLRGIFHGIAKFEYRERSTGNEQSMIMLHVSEPVVLDEWSNPTTELLLPDYALTPITSVVRYAFLPKRADTDES